MRNAYFVGASTHPGTGVPIVLAGAKITAEQILGDKKMEVPWVPLREWKGDVQAKQGNEKRGGGEVGFGEEAVVDG